MEEERAGTPNKFIVLRQEVLYDANLTIAEKFVYARMCQFDEYFESCAEAGRLLGLSAESVKKAKQKIVRLGYAKELVNTGRGKVYKVYEQPGQETTDRRVKSTHQTGKIEPVRRVKSTRRVIELEKKENIIDNKLSIIGEDAEHGNPDINEMFGLWEQQFGFAQKQSAENRRACYNLLRRKDLGKDKLAKVIQLLGEAQTDRFLPKEVRSIVGFATLQANLPNLLMWARRKYAQSQTQTGVEI